MHKETNGIFKLHHTHKHTKSKTTHKQPCSISTAVEPRRRSSSAHGNSPPINRPYHQPPSEVSSAERWYLWRPSSILRSLAAMIVVHQPSTSASLQPPTMPPISSHRSAHHGIPWSNVSSAERWWSFIILYLPSSFLCHSIVCSNDDCLFYIAADCRRMMWTVGGRLTINNRYVSIAKWYDNAYAIVTNAPFILYSATAHELTTSAERQK